MTPAVQDASCAAGVFLCRGSEALPSGSYPPSKKEYFLTATTPQALARGVSAQLVQKPRRVSPPQRRKKVKSFSQATCAAKKILLRLQVWNLCAVGAQIMRAADCSPFVKKEYFLTATTPQAIACGVASAWPRFIASEAGLAPSGSPAALSHNSAATDSLQNSDNPAGDCLRGCLSMTLQAQRSVFLHWDAGELRLRQITQTALPSSRQTAS